VLDLSNPLPPSTGAQQRWTAEPVSHIWLPATSFIPNAKGYPVLSKACQAFVRGMAKQEATFLLAETTATRHSAGGPDAYVQYLRHVTSQPSPQLPPSARVPEGLYGDRLQPPLQPLMNDLGCETYDAFERDPVKYQQYEEAIFLAVEDRAKDAAAVNGDPHTVIVVAGAGRGPLVACALRALERAGVPGRVYAIEKNPAALTTLQERKDLEWGNAVEILFGDMRTLEVPELADILVSELLGSFGDNELSPECIDGGMRFLKDDGLSIPTSYTAWLAPIASSKLYNAVMEHREDSAREVPYVVMMQQVNLLSANGGGASGRCGLGIQQCWQFEHPRRDLVLDGSGLPVTNSHNTRSATLTFHIPHASPCHGFAGYFEAHLYGNIGLSTHPETAESISPYMFSWFPLFFPLKAPLYLPSGAELEVNIWRLIDQRSRKVWYEWAAEAYLPVAAPASSSPGMPPNPNPNANTHRPATSSTSPLMDAPFSPTNQQGFVLQQQQAQSEIGRVKIGQTDLHNPAGRHYWVGL
jgi:protein arginine N-methyltransferase 5